MALRSENRDGCPQLVSPAKLSPLLVGGEPLGQGGLPRAEAELGVRHQNCISTGPNKRKLDKLLPCLLEWGELSGRICEGVILYRHMTEEDPKRAKQHLASPQAESRIQVFTVHGRRCAKGHARKSFGSKSALVRLNQIRNAKESYVYMHRRHLRSMLRFLLVLRSWKIRGASKMRKKQSGLFRRYGLLRQLQV